MSQPAPPVILVADDRQESRELVGDLLAEHGFRVLMAADGREALQLVSQQEIRLVVTDLHMPNLDGVELLDHLRRENPDIQVIMFTGDCRLPLGMRALARGAFYFLEKPVRSEELIALVDKALVPSVPGETAGISMELRRGLP